MRRKRIDPSSGVTIKIDYAQPHELVPDKDNPRFADDEALRGICRSIVEFGIVDPLVVRRSDRLIIGGHQRHQAVLRLLSGPFTYKGAEGKMITVEWRPPAEGIPVVYLDNLDDRRTKLLNLALNRATGEWEKDRLALLLKGLTEGEGALDIYELGATAFSVTEINEYIALAEDGPAGGEAPQPSTHAPKLSLDFLSEGARDAVKAAIAAQNKGKEPSGEVLARMLGVRGKRKRAA